MPAACFVVRATVTDAGKREAFDAWYSREHLPDAVKSFGAAKAWRHWSVSEPSLHLATYQFADQATMERAVHGGADMKRLIADFNRDWPDVTRTREMLVLAEEVVAEVMVSPPGRYRTSAKTLTLSSAIIHLVERIFRHHPSSTRKMSWNAGTS